MKKILIIDDEKDFCTLMKWNLESTGEYEVTTAYTGEDGLKNAREIDFDLVITDFKLPGISGEKVLDTLKKMKPCLPVLFFSIYYDDASTISASCKNKADGLIVKPIEHSKLHKTIKDVLARSGKSK